MKKTHVRRGEKGSILITSLWMISILTVMTGNLGFQARQELMVVKRELQNLEAKADFISALQLFYQKLAEDPAPYEDSLEDGWQGTVPLAEPWAGRVKILAEDEESKLNLNTATRPMLEAFLKNYAKAYGSLKGNRRDVVKQILKFRAEKPIVSLDQLLLLEDVESEDIRKLLPWLTVFPQLPQMNINTINPLVLESLIDSISSDQSAKREFLRKLDEFHREARRNNFPPVLTTDDLAPGPLMKRLKLTPNPQTLMLLHQLVQYLTIDSQYYHLKIKNSEGGAAEAWVRDEPDTGGLTVLSWHEN